jgi:hypothetical protein
VGFSAERRFLQVDDSKTLTVHAALAQGDPLADTFSHENEIGVLVLTRALAGGCE